MIVNLPDKRVIREKRKHREEKMTITCHRAAMNIENNN